MPDTSPHSLLPFFGQAGLKRIAERLKLSPREVQIVQGVLDDQKESTIARRLRMSPHTVHTHMERLHGKLAVRTRSELILKILTTFLMMTAEPGSQLTPICGNRGSGRCPLNS